jgi:uncharacterized protein (TIGR02145 family)
MESSIKMLICHLLTAGLVIVLASNCTMEKDLGQPPALITETVNSITPTTANCGGNITTDGGATITARGVCWSTTHDPSILDSKTSDGMGTGTFTSAITGLTPTTTYFARAYATNSAATSYGKEISFKTYTDTLSDIDGNVYYTITIGSQTWMAENLKTTKYNDNTAIPLVTFDHAWSSLSKPGYCWYNNDAEAYKESDGALYNWFAVDTISNEFKNVCPAGWHVPDNAEWTVLSTFLGGESVAGGKLKESGYNNWQSPNTDATNESGFTALPGGGRYYDGRFSSIGTIGGWWTSTEILTTHARGRYLYNDHNLIYSGSGDKRDGFSVRCLKD